MLIRILLNAVSLPVLSIWDPFAMLHVFSRKPPLQMTLLAASQTRFQFLFLYLAAVLSAFPVFFPRPLTKRAVPLPFSSGRTRLTRAFLHYPAAGPLASSSTIVRPAGALSSPSHYGSSLSSLLTSPSSPGFLLPPPGVGLESWSRRDFIQLRIISCAPTP